MEGNSKGHLPPKMASRYSMISPAAPPQIMNPEPAHALLS